MQNALQGGSGVLNVKMGKNGLAGKNLLLPRLLIN